MTLRSILLASFVFFLISCNSKDTKNEEKHNEKAQEEAVDPSRKAYPVETKESKTVVLTTPKNFARHLSEGLKDGKKPQLIDVRTPKEFSEGYLESARNIDISAGDFKEKIAALDKEKPVFLYCRSGGRSGRAAEMLKEMGFEKIYDLEGGILAWQKEKMAVVRPI